MKRVAYASTTYLFTFEPHEVGMPDDCTDLELEAAVTGYLNRIFEETVHYLGMPNDIEIEISNN